MSWTEPWEVSRKRTLAELCTAGVLSWKLWVRCTLIAAIVGLLIIVAMLIWAPGVAIPWPQVIVILLVYPFVIFGVSVVPSILSPVSVKITDQAVQVSNGQSGMRIRARDIRRVSIDESGERPVFRMAYVSRNGAMKERAFALAARVNREKLACVLADLLANNEGNVGSFRDLRDRIL